MRAMFDDIEFQVLGSHIKIPMIFLVPVMFLVSLYVIVYFFANSVMALDVTEHFLHDAIGGKIEVRELVVEPNLTQVHLYHAKLLDQDKKKVLTVTEIHAAIRPLMLLRKHIDVSEARVVGADVHMRISKDGLNLIRALGLDKKDPNEDPNDNKNNGPPEIHLSNIRFEKSRYTLIVDDVFEFTIPTVDIPFGEIHIAPGSLQMYVPGWHAPRANFRFYHQLFDFPASRGDWTFTMYDFKLKEWRWINDGYTVESMSANVEGYEIDIKGQMGFPTDERGMTYKADASLSIPFWSPFIQYFAQDNIHFDIPTLNISTEGTLQWIEGKARLFANKIHAQGITAEDVTAEVSLHNQMVVVEQANAKFNGGKIDVDYAYFDLLQQSYGANVEFESVNPASVMDQLKAPLPFMGGRASGAFTATGKMPSSIEFKVGKPTALLDHARDRWIDLTVTRDFVLQRNNSLLLPSRTFKMMTGSRVWVDLDRVVMPQARFKLGADDVRLDNFALNYLDMRLESVFDTRGAQVRANFRALTPYLQHYGVDNVTTGPASAIMYARGPLMAPSLLFDATVETPIFDGQIKATNATIKARVDDGVLSIKSLALKTPLGQASATGKIDVFSTAPDPEMPVMLRYQPRRSMKASINATFDNIDVAIAKPFLPASLKIKGMVDAKASIRGALDRMVLCMDATTQSANIYGQPIQRIDLQAALRDPGLKRGCFGRAPPAVTSKKRRVEVSKLDVSLGQAGSLNAKGFWGMDQSYDIAMKGQNIDLSKLEILRKLPVSVDARGDVILQGKGTLKSPSLGGSLRLKDARVAGLSVGDLAFVVNTTSAKNVDPFTGKVDHEHTLNVVGAVLPWLTAALEIPLDATSPIYAKIGFDDLNVVNMAKQTGAAAKFEAINTLTDLRQLRMTGTLQFYYYRDQPYPGYSLIATLPKLNLGPKRLNLSNQKTISVGYTRQEGPDGPLTDRVTIEHFSLGSNDKYLTIVGSVTPQDAFVDLDVDGELDLGLGMTIASLVPDLVPEEVVDVTGSVGIDATLSGEPSTLSADGRVDLRQSTVQFRSLSEPLTLKSGAILLDKNNISIERNNAIRGEILGGSFNVWGTMGLDKFKPSFATLNIWSHNMSFSVPDVASVTFDTNLAFNATNLLNMKTWKLGGQVEFLDGLFYKDISVFEKELTGRVMGAFNRRTEVFEASILDQFPELKQVALDVTVKARDGFKLKNQIERFTLDLEFRFQLLLSNTLDDLRLTGDIEVVDGAIIFQGKKFTVRTGVVRFEGDPANPFVDVIAGADIRNVCKESVQAQELTPPIALTSSTNDDEQDTYHISLNVRGRPDKLNLLYESTPYVDQRDVISLILTGCTVDLLTASSASQPTLETILGPLIGRLEREIQDVVKVEEFTIVPGVQRTQVRISDSLTRRLSWKLQLDTQYNDASGQYSQLEYKLTDRMSFQLSEGTQTNQNQTTNSNTRLTVDLKLKYRISLD